MIAGDACRLTRRPAETAGSRKPYEYLAKGLNTFEYRRKWVCRCNRAASLQKRKRASV